MIMLMLVGLALVPQARAQEALVTVRIMALETALKLARTTLEACRKEGFQVTVAVVDRMGVTQVLLRDRFAGAHTVVTATRKAWTAASFRVSTTELADRAKPGTPIFGAHHVPGALLVGGGLQVLAAGSTVGGIGVSGGVSGAADDACAKIGIEAIADDLNF
jgi:uncharacterized protein GlcG (DUF336 family)